MREYSEGKCCLKHCRRKERKRAADAQKPIHSQARGSQKPIHSQARSWEHHVREWENVHCEWRLNSTMQVSSGSIRPGSSCSVTKSSLTLCDPMDYSPPGSSDHGILQARILEWVAISFSRGSSRPKDWTPVSSISRQVLYHWPTREACTLGWKESQI